MTSTPAPTEAPEPVVTLLPASGPAPVALPPASATTDASSGGHPAAMAIAIRIARTTAAYEGLDALTPLRTVVKVTLEPSTAAGDAPMDGLTVAVGGGERVGTAVRDTDCVAAPVPVVVPVTVPVSDAVPLRDRE